VDPDVENLADAIGDNRPRPIATSLEDWWIINRPALEVADILRSFGARFVERSRARISLPGPAHLFVATRCQELFFPPVPRPP